MVPVSWGKAVAQIERDHTLNDSPGKNADDDHRSDVYPAKHYPAVYFHIEKVAGKERDWEETIGKSHKKYLIVLELETHDKIFQHDKVREIDAEQRKHEQGPLGELSNAPGSVFKEQVEQRAVEYKAEAFPYFFHFLYSFPCFGMFCVPPVGRVERENPASIYFLPERLYLGYYGIKYLILLDRHPICLLLADWYSDNPLMHLY
jgi:hypothetical protein